LVWETGMAGYNLVKVPSFGHNTST